MPGTGRGRSTQRGVVLLIALIVLVAMTLGGIALVRSVDLTNIIAGNLAFKQAATHSGDAGIEQAIVWLETNKNGTLLNSDQPSEGYSANGNNSLRSPSAGQSWDAYWSSLPTNRIKTLNTDASGNTVSYIIDRMCSLAGDPATGAQCSSSVVVSSPGGMEEEGGAKSISPPSGIYYRITSRIVGPKNTVSYVQAMVSM